MAELMQRTRDIVDADCDLTPATKLLLNSLVAHMNWSTGFTQVGALRIAKERGVGEATAKRGLGDLVWAGHAIREPGKVSNHGRRGGITVTAVTTLPVLLKAAEAIRSNREMVGSNKPNGRIKKIAMVGSINSNGRVENDPQTLKNNQLDKEPEAPECARDVAARASVAQALRHHVGAAKFDAWFAGFKIEFPTTGTVRLTAPSTYVARTVQQEHADRIGKAIHEALGAGMQWEITHEQR
jgi:hypothetical protein